MPSLKKPRMLIRKRTKLPRTKRTTARDLKARANIPSALVANTNVSSQRQKQGGNNYRKTERSFQPPATFEEAVKRPCLMHNKPGRPVSHTWEDCNFMKEFARRGAQGPTGSGSGA